jgi:hypothetical protein
MAKRKSAGKTPDTASDRSSNPSTPEPVRVTEQEIAERAYALYLARGCQPGHDIDDWLQAEQELRGGAAGGSSEPTVSKRAVQSGQK